MVTLIPSCYNEDQTAPSAESSFTHHTTSSHLIQLTNVISKLIQIVLRSRLGSDYYCIRHAATHQSNCYLTITPHVLPQNISTTGWELGMRIYHQTTLLEHWIIKYNPFTTSTSITPTTATTSSSISYSTNILLLLQSAYSHTRLLPVQNLLTHSQLTKEQLGFMITTIPSTFSMETITTTDNSSTLPFLGCHSSLPTTSVLFGPQASVATHHFPKVDCMDLKGQLSLQVMYDENIGKIMSTTVPGFIFESNKATTTDIILPATISSTSSSSSTTIPSDSCYQQRKQQKQQQEHLLLAVTQPTTMIQQLHIPTKSTSFIGVRRLSRLSLSALHDDDEEKTQQKQEEEEEQEKPDQYSFYESSPSALTIPMSTSPIQYTHHGHSLAYSTSPSATYHQQRRSSIPLHHYHQHHHHHHGLAGSYEESLLSGRMSTLQPSKPIWFHCQIGALGHGRVKSSLKCPPHRSVVFPAFFYDGQSSMNSLNNKWMDESVSTPAFAPPPYVGTVDLTVDEDNKPSPGYRIPSKGQLQIAIKNPNKSLVKLFLINYDVSQMPRNTKTFLRQKSYCSTSLKYVVHIQLCRTEKNRVYLYKQIRVVFVNRCMDAREQYHVICEGPNEPVYTSLI
ncbi:uncharacterized protein BX664DRAFT_335778 [Halteromyces radiatus]|uniref:uncharacterized protein n=1 Tax=Halteromyces radiatus TaxID=101107 RepID=UPI0022200807|nr:uncharacterized protein BX664DRAFT_335778 [Halteromyces radiatus]KAI8086434.1 hypothetical protein BX664DRAFT_335778 [Halteromyces radiatus]